MGNEEITIFGETNFRGERRRFGIKTDDRRRHMYLIGKTGVGKTTTLENMIISDIRAGHGVGVVDPHGDLAEKILDFVPSPRINDVIYFNPADLDYPIAFNILEAVDPRHKHLVASGMMGVFKKIWPDVWSARMEYILNNTVLALLDYPGATMLGINRMLADKDYRKKVIAKIKDPVVKAFWVDEFAKYHDRFATEAIAPIQNKVGQFLSASIIRNIVGQVKSTIDMRKIMDEQKIFIMNLAKGRIGEDASALLGGMLITRLQLAAMGRVDIPEEERKDFYLYVDEFQNFATLSFANILSEARKYRLNLILAHQYIEQLDEKVAAAVFGNVGTIICFRVGAADAEELVKEFTPYFTEEDLVNLSKYDFYVKLMIDGVASHPFSATGLPPVTGATGNKEKIIRVSRERYAKPREVVEEKIIRWSGMEIFEKGEEKLEKEIEEKMMKKEEKVVPVKEEEIEEALEEKAKKVREAFLERPKVKSVDFIKRFEEMSKPEEKKEIELPKPVSLPKAALPKEEIKAKALEERFPYKVKCSACGKDTRVSFKPDGIRPVYCKECLKIVKEKERQAKRVKKEKVPPLTKHPSTK